MGWGVGGCLGILLPLRLLPVRSPCVESFVCILAVEKAPINLSQVMWASLFSEEASAPMYLTNDRLRDRGKIIGSFHLQSVEQGAVSLVASRGQQPLVIRSPAGRGKAPRLSNLLLTRALEVVRCSLRGVTWTHTEATAPGIFHLCFLCPQADPLSSPCPHPHILTVRVLAL